MAPMRAFCLRVNFVQAAYFWKIIYLEETGKHNAQAMNRYLLHSCTNWDPNPSFSPLAGILSTSERTANSFQMEKDMGRTQEDKREEGKQQGIEES